MSSFFKITLTFSSWWWRRLQGAGRAWECFFGAFWLHFQEVSSIFTRKCPLTDKNSYQKKKSTTNIIFKRLDALQVWDEQGDMLLVFPVSTEPQAKEIR